MRKIAEIIVKNNAVKFGEFILSSSKKSDIYIDLRVLISKPEAYFLIIEELKNLVLNFNFHGIAGIPTAGLPWASFLAFYLKKPLIYVRKEVKEYGLSKEIEGDLEKNSEILIIDDVATTGNNILISALKLRKEGYIVKNAVVIVDREEGALERLKNNNINLFSLTKKSEILEIIK